MVLSKYVVLKETLEPQSPWNNFTIYSIFLLSNLGLDDDDDQTGDGCICSCPAFDGWSAQKAAPPNFDDDDDEDDDDDDDESKVEVEQSIIECGDEDYGAEGEA